nr:hypothetical protein [Tanacetum cinerariifolium]
LQSVEERLVHYKKNEAVFADKINILNLEVKLRDNAIVEYTKKLEKAKKKRDELIQTLERFQNSSKSLNNLMESQNLENVKSRLDKGYNTVPLPYTWNYIPPKPDLMFIDEQVESESMDIVSNVSSSVVKTVKSIFVKNKGVYNTVETKPVKKNSFIPLIIEDWNYDDESEVEFKPKVEVKGKEKMIEPEKPLKKKDQIALDEEVARKLEAEMRAEIEKEERIARKKDEANRAMIEEWDDVLATIDANRQLAEQIQAQEREQLCIEERSKLLVELIESKRKYFAAKRAEEIKNKPPIKAQQKSLMCTYMINIKGFKQKEFKGKSFDDIKKMFEKVYKRVNTFVDMNTENVEENLKKTQVEEQAKVANDDTAELKRCLEIVLEDDDDVAIKATPLSSKSPTIVDYKIYKERKKSYFKIIRADRNSQNYLTFGTMFKNFNIEYLEVLMSIVKERFKKIKPVDDIENILFQTLKTMFEPHVEDIIWKYQQRAVKVNNWNLFDSCRVYCVTTKNMVYYLMVEKMYSFTNNVLHQLWSDVRLQVDYEVEMAYDLLKLIRRKINEGYKPE